MSNMAYCRFQNTLGDLRDCQENMDEHPRGDDEPGEGLSSEEQLARRRLIEICVDIAENYGDEVGG